MPSIQPRSVIGTPQPPATRRRLMRVGVLLAHEVGVATSSSGRYQSANPARVLDDARAAASFGVAAGKSWEYSYMLGRDGSIFEQAGEFMASHCLNFNQDSLGVIWLNALGLPPTQAQLDAWWWLRSHLVDTGQLTELHTVAPHYRYRSTSCCGVLAEPPGVAWKSPTGEGRLGNLLEALTVEPGPPAPPIEEDDMVVTNQEVFHQMPALMAKWWLQDDGVLRYLDPVEWETRGSKPGSPWLNDSLERHGAQLL